MAKAKWLVEGSNLDLINVIVKGIAEGAADKDVAKVAKAAAELQERFEAEQAEPSVMGILAHVSKALVDLNGKVDQAGALYLADIEAAGQVTEADAEEETPAPRKEKKTKKSKKTKNEDAAEVKTLTDMSKKELVAYAKELGIKVSKKMSPEDVIAAIENATVESDN